MQTGLKLKKKIDNLKIWNDARRCNKHHLVDPNSNQRNVGGGLNFTIVFTKKLDHFTIKNIYFLEVKLSSLFGTSLMILTLGIRDWRTTDEDSKLYSKL